MRTFPVSLLLVPALLLESCIDPYEAQFRSTVDVVVVDGTITNLDEPQLVRLNRSKTVSGLYLTVPLTGAQVEVVADEARVYALAEREAGSYYLPADFKGQVGHRYQLRFRLQEGTQYESSLQVMPPAVPISRVVAQFNPNSLPANPENLTGAHEFFLDTQDPAGERNYYKWGWTLYEQQEWCRTCFESYYAVSNIVVTSVPHLFQYGDQPFEACWTPPPISMVRYGLFDKRYDYRCRTQCWEVIHSKDLNLFDDALTNGGIIRGRKVAQIPVYQARGCLVEIRQAALTTEAHRFYKLVENLTEVTGGLADTPPAALAGNVKNTADPREIVVVFFTASGVGTLRYWLDRKDAVGVARGLFQSLNGRSPELGPGPPIDGVVTNSPSAVCAPSVSRTPYKPEDWQE